MDVRARTILATLLILLLVMGSSGCLSIHSVKEALMFQQEEDEVVYWKVTPSPVEVYWEASKVLPADTYASTETFKVKDGAKWIKLDYDIALPSSLLGEREILNYTVYFNPEVTLRLRTPTNEIVWERNFTDADSNTIPIQGPGPGIWTLRIEAKGYGGEAFGMEARDKLRVVVDLYEPK
jgi:hypothetical protein